VSDYSSNKMRYANLITEISRFLLPDKAKLYTQRTFVRPRGGDSSYSCTKSLFLASSSHREQPVECGLQVSPTLWGL
jgi:hypothetical protein